MDDDRLLLAQAEDLISRCQYQDIPTHSGFLDARQQSLLRRTFGVRQGDVEIVYWGGYKDADRVMMFCLPYYMETPPHLIDPEEPDLPPYCRETLVVIRATAPKGSGASRSGRALSHSDYLGALMGLGIKRSVVGDILVHENGADIIIDRDMEAYIIVNFLAAGRANLSLEALPLSDLRTPEASFKEVTDTVASLRLDAVLASAFRISRGKAAEAIRQGLVFVDHLEATKPDLPVAEGAELVIRHLGKAKLVEVGGKSRKDRINIKLHRYGNK